MRRLVDHQVDRPEVYGRQRPQPTGTNQSIGLISSSLDTSRSLSTNPLSSRLGVPDSTVSGPTDAGTREEGALVAPRPAANAAAVRKRPWHQSASRCPYLAGNTRSLSEHGSQAARADDSA
jgi:hypothetical protein